MTMTLNKNHATAGSCGVSNDDETECFLAPTSINSCTFFQVFFNFL